MNRKTAWYKEIWVIAVGIVLITTLIGLHATTPTETKEFTFKNTRWEMSKAQVIASETGTFLGVTPLSGGDECMEYKTETAKLYYYFTDNKLNCTLYMLGPLEYNKSNPNLKYHFEGYKEVFDNKYGEQIGKTAKSEGEDFTVYEAEWETNTTHIDLMVSGSINNLYCNIRFKSL